jgi:hypothetical protein
MPSVSLAELARSFLDLWHHFDAVEARRFDREGPEPRLRPFDRDGLRQQVAAIRSLEGAALELDLEGLDDEIDRTILLAAIRPQIRRHERDHPERVNPTIWSGRLRSVLEVRAGDPATLEAIPGWVEAAREAIAAPGFAFLQVALDDLAAARIALASAQWWQVDKELLSQAAAALDRLDQFLRHDARPNPAADAGALGDEAVAWHLHHAALIEMGGDEAARKLRYESEMARLQVEPVGGVSGLDLRGAAAAYGQGLLHQSSEIRRRVAPPSWLDAFALFAAGAAVPADSAPVLTRWDRLRLGRLDLEVQLARQDPAKALTDAPAPLGPALIRYPLEATFVALLVLEWEALRAKWAGDLGSLIGAVVEHGVMHPALAGWRLGLA